MPVETAPVPSGPRAAALLDAPEAEAAARLVVAEAAPAGDGGGE